MVYWRCLVSVRPITGESRGINIRHQDLKKIHQKISIKEEK